MDDRLYQVEQQKQQALNQSNNMYNGLLNDNQTLYNQQKEFADNQERIQNEILDKQLANQTRKIEQQKQTARDNYDAESKRAKNDYTSFINPYGVQAESFASRGLLNSGVSETSKLGGYNSYQNRLASANKVMQDAFVQYDNDLNDAILNNDVQKAQNALNRLQMQLQYSQDFFNNKSTISQNQLSNNQGLDSDYFNRYQTVYGNIEQEKARAEAIRQWEAEMAYKKEQDKIAQQQWQKEYQLSLRRLKASSGGASQKLTDGSSAKLTNGENNAQENNNSNNNTNSSQVLTATMSPILSNKMSESWYDKNFSSSMSLDDLNKMIALGESQGQLNPKDREKIYASYGLK